MKNMHLTKKKSMIQKISSVFLETCDKAFSQEKQLSGISLDLVPGED